jgi:hypothetical protein
VENPRQIGDQRWIAIAAAHNVSAGIRQDGALWRWGGEPGRAGNWKPEQIPVPAALVEVWLEWPGWNALDRDGALWRIEFPFYSDPVISQIPFPPKKGPPLKVVENWSGRLAIAADGTLWEWNRTRDFLGDRFSNPTQIGPRQDWLAVGMSRSNRSPPRFPAPSVVALCPFRCFPLWLSRRLIAKPGAKWPDLRADPAGSPLRVVLPFETRKSMKKSLPGELHFSIPFGGIMETESGTALSPREFLLPAY